MGWGDVQLRYQNTAPRFLREPGAAAASPRRRPHFGSYPAPQWEASEDGRRAWQEPRDRDPERSEADPAYRNVSRARELDRATWWVAVVATGLCIASCALLLRGEISAVVGWPSAAMLRLSGQIPSSGSAVDAWRSGKSDSLFASIDAEEDDVDDPDSGATYFERAWNALKSRRGDAAAVSPGRSHAPRMLRDGVTRTNLVAFESAPFPYDGKMPGSNRPFLDAGAPGHRGHTNFRGRVLWESETFNDARVLLHIPEAFDPTRPGVMVVFFHGHGANLERDVRDRQQVPAQITASGANAVLVAPQFAVDAADSSAGKFWEPGGFKRFLDEAADRLATLYGDPHTSGAFARMPIVLVAYSGGFGPTLSVLDRGGVKSRVRGIVLLDALYSGTSQFANWIANDRSTFFVSSYTPHTQRLNAELAQLIRERSIPYGSELKHRQLAGSVTFLPTGSISHRDFVNRAWVESPLKDILVRLDEYNPGVETAAATSEPRPRVAAAPPGI
jgi:hypothetical protein